MTLVLGDYIDFISGPAFKSNKFTDSVEDVPLVKGDNLAQGYIKWEQSKYWPAQDVEAFTKYYLCPGDIVLAMDRPWVTAGLKFARIKESDPLSLVVQRIARLRAINGMSQDFLHALIGSKNFEEYIRNIMGGTNVPHISPAQIRAYEFDADKSSFAKVGSIYKSYTDLIENNRRRIQLLEESARLLYQEWFVHLRFPGHEQVKIADGVPEGWEKKPISSFGRVITGKTPSTKNDAYYGDDVPFIKTPDMHGNVFVVSTSQSLSESGSKSQQSTLLPSGCIMVSCIGTVGVVSINPLEAHTNQQINSVIPENKYFVEFLFYGLKKIKPMLEAIGASSTMNNVNKSKFSSLELLMPSEKLITEFHFSVASTFDLIFSLQKQNLALAKARDLLLPKLMSGELTV